MKQVIRLFTAVAGAFSLAFLLTTAALPGSTDTEYIMRDYNGKVAVFREGANTPDEVFDVFTNSLPPDEHERLINGITIQGDEELQKMIEAYTG